MRAVFYLGAGWPQWKPLGIPGTHLPLKRGSWLNLVKCNLTKLTTTSLAVKRSTSLVVKRFTSLAVIASSPPLPSLFFFLPLFHQCDGCLEWGLMAGLRGFASHGGSFLSSGWLAIVEAPGYTRDPPST